MPPANILDRREEYAEPEEFPDRTPMLGELGRLERRGVLGAQVPGEVVMAALDEPPEGEVLLQSRQQRHDLRCVFRPDAKPAEQGGRLASREQGQCWHFAEVMQVFQPGA